VKRRIGACLALALLVPAAPARADIVLNGSFHTGAADTATEFTPLDPVECTKYRSNPQTFHLTESATITGFTLHDAVDTDNAVITVDIDGTQRSAVSCTACDLCDGTSSCGDITVTLTTGVSLSAGDHTVAVIDPSGASGNCLSSNDFGWSKLTLLSSATTTSIMLNRRRHIGDSDDSDDDYDTNDNANPFYPDPFEGDPITQSFTLPQARRLTDVKLYRLRDLDTSDATVKVDGTTIGTLANTGDPYETNPTTVSRNLLLDVGTHTVTVDAGNLAPSSIDDFSWDAIILRFADATSAGTPGFFNAVDTLGGVISGSIKTKTAGGLATLDLYALDGTGTAQLVTYSGTTTVEVLDASNNSGATDVYGCNSAWTAAQTLGTSVVFIGGKATLAATLLDAGLKEARIRITDNSTNARGCSLDNFAIVPASLEVVATHATESTPGTAALLDNTTTAGTVIHRAGREFSITVTGKTALGATVTNYDGTPDLIATPIAPATNMGDLLSGSWGSASGGSRRTDQATYDEVGGVTIKAEDTTWASVDADDTDPDDRKFSGVVDAGRFVPDHFRVVDGALSPSCTNGTSGFSYLGSTLFWASPAVKLVAENAANETTQNYTAGALLRLSTTEIGTPTYTAPVGALSTVDSIVDITAPAPGEVAINLPELVFARNLIGAFDANILIQFPDFDGDKDGIKATEDPLQLGETGGVAFTNGLKSQRFGRLYFEPKYGSELLPMKVSLRAEYFDGAAFVLNADDTCTSIQQAHVGFTGLPGQSHVVAPVGPNNGLWTVTIQPPNPSTQGTATLKLDLPTAVPYPLLADDTSGDGVYAEDPERDVYFGLHAQDEKWIYQRDVTGD
jgi:hypothetical protein